MPRARRIVGIHNYSEVNRKLGDKRSAASFRKYPGTRRIIAAVRKANKRAKFWYTETGGVTKLGSGFAVRRRRARPTGRSTCSRWPRSSTRYVDRLYSYNWTPTPVCATARFDAGLINPDGSPRPAFAVFKSNLKNFKR